MRDLRVASVPEQEFGAAVLEELRTALLGETDPVIGLPTGRTPIPLYEEMVRQRFTFPEGSQLFAIDEYCSATLHAGTNGVFFRRWLPPSAFPPVLLPRHDATDADAEVARYCKRLRATGGLTIAVVGIGANGHVAFNEPGSTEFSSCRVVQLAESTRAQVADHWQPEPTHGMTLGMDDILRARKVIVLASGPAKAAILAAALTGPETPAVPASFLRRHSGLSVVCDSSAASGLRS
ncbi:MAG: 6-phosphogluconolactonase [Tepidiformaceae bacterium]